MLNDNLMATVRRTVLEEKTRELSLREDIAVAVFNQRLEIVGATTFEKEEEGKPASHLTPQEVGTLKLRFVEMQRSLALMVEQVERAELALRGSERECKRLQREYATASADRETLVQTLLGCRKALARAESEVEEVKGELKAHRDALADEEKAGGEMAELRQRGGSSGGGGGGGAGASADTHQSVMELLVLLERERRASRQARDDLARDRALRTEAESVVRAAIADARAVNEKEREKVVEELRQRKKSPSLDDLVPKAVRSDLLSDLLSKEAILAALYGVIFPPQGTSTK